MYYFFISITLPQFMFDIILPDCQELNPKRLLSGMQTGNKTTVKIRLLKVTMGESNN